MSAAEAEALGRARQQAFEEHKRAEELMRRAAQEAARAVGRAAADAAKRAVRRAADRALGRVADSIRGLTDVISGKPKKKR